MQSSYILQSQTHVHLAELEAGVCHGANSCPVRENIINVTTNPVNSSWISQEFLQAIASSRSPTALIHHFSHHLLPLFIPEQHPHPHHLPLRMVM